MLPFLCLLSFSLYCALKFFSGPQYSQLIRAQSSPIMELMFPKGLAEHTRENTTINMSLLVKGQSNNCQSNILLLLQLTLSAPSFTKSSFSLLLCQQKQRTKITNHHKSTDTEVTNITAESVPLWGGPCGGDRAIG